MLNVPKRVCPLFSAGPIRSYDRHRLQVEVFAACGAHVTAIARDRAKLAAAERAGAAVIPGYAIDATFMNRIVSEETPDVLIRGE